MKLILASQSEARRRLLKRLGLSFKVKPAHIDEESVARKIADPRRLALTLAKLKAAAVFRDEIDAIVIGSDQLLECEGRIYGKPYTVAGAEKQLMRFSGREISLWTAVAVQDQHGVKSFAHRTRMKFRKLTRAEIAAYVAADRPLECAGSFRFEGHGITLFDAVKTDDPTAIEGLPLLHLARVLRDFRDIDSRFF